MSHQKLSPLPPAHRWLLRDRPRIPHGQLDSPLLLKEAKVRAADACLPGYLSPHRLDYSYLNLGNERDQAKGEGYPGGEGEKISISPSRSLFRQNEKSSLLNHKAIKKLKIS